MLVYSYCLCRSSEAALRLLDHHLVPNDFILVWFEMASWRRARSSATTAGLPSASGREQGRRRASNWEMIRGVLLGSRRDCCQPPKRCAAGGSKQQIRSRDRGAPTVDVLELVKAVIDPDVAVGVELVTEEAGVGVVWCQRRAIPTGPLRVAVVPDPWAGEHAARKQRVSLRITPEG